jgi:hypothetical protein
MNANKWLRGWDLNPRPPGYEPDELPTAPPRDIKIKWWEVLGSNQRPPRCQRGALAC